MAPRPRRAGTIPSSMSADPAQPPLEIAARRVGTRHHALVRHLTRATVALVTFSMSGLLVLSLIYPRQSMAPPWALIPVGLALIASVATAAAALLAQIACVAGGAGMAPDTSARYHPFLHERRPRHPARDRRPPRRTRPTRWCAPHRATVALVRSLSASGALADLPRSRGAVGVIPVGLA